MKRTLIYAAIAAIATTTLIAATDVLQQLSVSKSDASKEVISSLANGNVNFYRVRNAFKAATPAARAAMTEQVLVWTKAYVSSPQFAKDYAAYRNDAKPQPDDEEGQLSVDQELEQRRAQRKAELEQAKKSIAEMPAEYRAAAEEGYKAAVEAMKQFDTPEFRKMEREGVIAERQGNAEDHQQRLAQWEQAYPADPRELVKVRLQQFLEATEDVDYDAQLVSRHSKMRFANAEYEQKPANWKLAYRAGEDSTEKARAFAKGWLGELE